MIAILYGSLSPEKRECIDIKITNTFPIIKLPSKVRLVDASGTEDDVSSFDHLSIPPDLRVHLSAGNQHRYFDVEPALARLQSNVDVPPTRLFTYVHLPRPYCLPGSAAKSFVRDQVAIVSPLYDELFDPTRTRAFVDFFVHSPACTNKIAKQPLAAEGMRLAFDRTGCTFGPYAFQGIQRRLSCPVNLLFTLRYGYVEHEPDDTAFVFIPFEQQ